MKYLKHINESLTKDDLDIIKDILLELSDIGFGNDGEIPVKQLHSEPDLDRYYIKICKDTDIIRPTFKFNEVVLFKFNEVKDAIYRLKDIIGDDLLEFKYMTYEAAYGNEECAYKYKLKELKNETIDDNLGLYKIVIKFGIKR